MTSLALNNRAHMAKANHVIDWEGKSSWQGE